jgi:hypothetical protein
LGVNHFVLEKHKLHPRCVTSQRSHGRLYKMTQATTVHTDAHTGIDRLENVS